MPSAINYSRRGPSQAPLERDVAAAADVLAGVPFQRLIQRPIRLPLTEMTHHRLLPGAELGVADVVVVVQDAALAHRTLHVQRLKVPSRQRSATRPSWDICGRRKWLDTRYVRP
jgi:hypothetical protein